MNKGGLKRQPISKGKESQTKRTPLLLSSATTVVRVMVVEMAVIQVQIMTNTCFSTLHKYTQRIEKRANGIAIVCVCV